jgi:acetyl-CoA carboxylase biotin carboxyl carrier protein
MNTKKIKELIELMSENDLTELEIEQEGMKVKLVKGSGDRLEQVVVPAQQVVATQPAMPAAESVRPGKEIKAPMVGTFYRAPSPESAPFIEVGDVISKGDVLCIIEAMKLMNEVKAEISGKITEILVENAEPVEFGQALFRVE